MPGGPERDYGLERRHARKLARNRAAGVPKHLTYVDGEGNQVKASVWSRADAPATWWVIPEDRSSRTFVKVRLICGVWTVDGR